MFILCSFYQCCFGLFFAGLEGKESSAWLHYRGSLWAAKVSGTSGEYAGIFKGGVTRTSELNGTMVENNSCTRVRRGGLAEVWP